MWDATTQRARMAGGYCSRTSQIRPHTELRSEHINKIRTQRGEGGIWLGEAVPPNDIHAFIGPYGAAPLTRKGHQPQGKRHRFPQRPQGCHRRPVSWGEELSHDWGTSEVTVNFAMSRTICTRRTAMRRELYTRRQRLGDACMTLISCFVHTFSTISRSATMTGLP